MVVSMRRRTAHYALISITLAGLLYMHGLEGAAASITDDSLLRPARSAWTPPTTALLAYACSSRRWQTSA
jgi:hypothetical protein